MRALFVILAALGLNACASGLNGYPGDPSLRIAQDLAAIAADETEGRDTGSIGHLKAANYVEERLRANGIPHVDRELVPLRQFSRDWNRSKLSIGRLGDRRAFEPIEEFFIGTSPVAKSCAVEGQAVFVGYGLDAPQHGIDDLRDRDLRGKVAVIMSGTPAGLAPNVAAELAAGKLERLSQTGAAGYVRVYSEAGEKRLSYDRLKRARDFAGMAWTNDAGEAQSTFGSIDCSATLNPSVSGSFFAGAPYSYAQLRALAEEGTLQLPSFAWQTRVSIEARNRFDDSSSPNLVARLPGVDPDRAREAIVLLAHLDHLGTDGSGGVFNGAYDNAFGAAIVLEVAKELAKGPTLNRTVVFAFTTAEEKGLVGADFLAQHFPEDLQPVAAINVDMPLLFNGLKDLVASGEELSTLGATARQVAQDKGVAIVPDPNPELALFIRSDHYRFHARGVPSLFFLAGPESQGAEGPEFMATRYHRISDDLSQNFDYKAAKRLADYVAKLTQTIANDPDKPSLLAAP
ncbi:MAG: M28 family peptidase [Pseudomonadota bacterium]